MPKNQVAEPRPAPAGPRGSNFTFMQLARGAARVAGKPSAFLFSVLSVLLWALAGPFFGFSDTWQLVINTGTTILTFLMVFLLQNSQNRDAEAVQIKLDELLRAVAGARNSLVQLENLEQEDLDRIRKNFEELAEHARRQKPANLPCDTEDLAT